MKLKYYYNGEQQEISLRDLNFKYVYDGETYSDTDEYDGLKLKIATEEDIISVPLVSDISGAANGNFFRYKADDTPALCVSKSGTKYRAATKAIAQSFTIYCKEIADGYAIGSVNPPGSSTGYYYCYGNSRFFTNKTAFTTLKIKVSNDVTSDVVREYASANNIVYKVYGYTFTSDGVVTRNDIKSISESVLVNKTNPFITVLYTKVGDYAIPAGTYEPEQFWSLISSYISNGDYRTVAAPFKATVNGQTVSVAANSKVYKKIVGSSPAVVGYISFNSLVDLNSNTKAACTSVATNFSGPATYICHKDVPGFGRNTSVTISISDVFGKYENYPITITNGILFN